MLEFAEVRELQEWEGINFYSELILFPQQVLSNGDWLLLMYARVHIDIVSLLFQLHFF